MRAPFGPLHLLRFTEALADDLVDGRLDKPGADALPIPVALAVVGDESAIALEIGVADCNRNQLGLQSARFWDHIICLYRPAQDHIICL